MGYSKNIAPYAKILEKMGKRTNKSQMKKYKVKIVKKNM